MSVRFDKVRAYVRAYLECEDDTENVSQCLAELSHDEIIAAMDLLGLGWLLEPEYDGTGTAPPG